MKALVYTSPMELEYRDEPDPKPEVGEALIRVEASGICGSDMHAYYGHDERRPSTAHPRSRSEWRGHQRQPQGTTGRG